MSIIKGFFVGGKKSRGHVQYRADSTLKNFFVDFKICSQAGKSRKTP